MSNAGNEEARFGVEELFYTRTDDRGVILAANSVFTRISGYDPSEAIGAPHKLIRHPTMPKSVFHQYWEDLKKGRVVSAFVNNRTKSGLSYWVVALVSPMDEGYVSVRFKPTTDRLAEIEALYADICAEEAKSWSADKDGARPLHAEVAKRGAEDYDFYVTRLLIAEFAARENANGGETAHNFEKLLEVRNAVRAMAKDAQKLADIFQRMRTTPVNMGIMASRIEQAGGPISAISGLYSSMSNEIGLWVKNFMSDSGNAFGRMEFAALDCVKTTIAAALQQEMLEQFAREGQDSLGEAFEEELELLRRETKLRDAAAKDALAGIKRDAREISRSVHVLKRHVMRLSSTRVMCEIESAKLETRNESFDGVVKQLGSFQKEIEDLHLSIQTATESIIGCLETEIDASSSGAFEFTGELSIDASHAANETRDAAA